MKRIRHNFLKKDQGDWKNVQAEIIPIPIF
jgi:hypothetical protein